ncbi:MAG: hypothetical protein Kow00109_18280 [Acidobacteriota bacterium]
MGWTALSFARIFHAMQSRSLVATTVVAWLAASLALLAAAPLPALRVEGNRFVDAAGRTVILRGLNAADPDKLARDGQWNERYFQEMARWGANVVRIPVHPAAWRSRGSDAYLDLLDRGVDWAEQHGLYVVIDWHSIGNLKERKFQHAMYETDIDETIQFWKTIAKRYQGRAVVAFYELFNEPTVSGPRFGSMTWPEWKEILVRIIAAVRREDPAKIVLVAGFDWAYDLRPVAENPLDAPNVAYVSHPYPQKRQPPWEEKWEADWGFVADEYPVFLTEVGFCLEDEPGAHIPVISDESYGRALTAYAEKKGVSWAAWVFDVDWSPMLISDWNFTPTTQGRFFKTYLQRWAGRNEAAGR